MPIGRMLAVGVVVTVGLTAAVGAVDWEGACVVAATLETTTCRGNNLPEFSAENNDPKTRPPIPEKNWTSSCFLT